MTGRVLVVDDDQDMCRLLATGLTRRGFAVTWTTSASEALDTVGRQPLDAVVTDVEMAGMNGLELCERLVADRPDVPVTMLTAHGNLDTAVAAIRAGAYDFITKPLEMDTLALAVERAVRHHTLRDDIKRLADVRETPINPGDVASASPSMQKVMDVLERVADTDTSMLIMGESGTGKELVARALHARGRRHDKPFIAVNCAAIPESLLESELFGHVRGAFTNAHTDRLGLFAQANGGTLFLDEIGELPLSLQPKLLRALQERAIRPVGGSVEIRCNARLIAATNLDLAAAVKERRFREDLYFRINVIEVNLPPLRARGHDVLVLAQHFITSYAAQAGKAVIGLSPAAAERLLAYSWPGNVRELQNCMERAVLLTRYDRIAVGDLPQSVRGPRGTTNAIVYDDAPETALSVSEVERRHILRVLEALGGNRTLAAQQLGLDRKTLYRKLLRYRA